MNLFAREYRLRARVAALVRAEWNDDLIWHYTSIDSLIAILKSDTLHLNSIRFMNDPAEGQVGRDIVQAAWDETLKEAGPCRLDVNWLRENSRQVPSLSYPGTDSHDTFALSFSRHKDMLSQWARYGDDGAGVALGFRINESELEGVARKSSPRSNWKFGPYISQVTYIPTNGDSSEGSQKFIALLALALGELLHDVEDDTELMNNLLTTAETLAPLVKSQGYNEEDEVRCWLRTHVDSTEIFDIKASKYGLATFVALPLRDSGLRVVEIVLGPKVSAETHQSFDWLKRKFNFGELIVSTSGLVYR